MSRKSNKRVAFYAPMKSPDHPTPSGDREIARLTMKALERAGFSVELVSELRLLEPLGNADRQAELKDRAKAETVRLCRTLGLDPPALWFTYHSYYKAPDLLGMEVTKWLGVPYVISEPSISPRRRDGAWAEFADLSEKALTRAKRLFWTTRRDRPALVEAGHQLKMRALPAFVAEGRTPTPRRVGKMLTLLTVAMMRPGDKLESYRRLAAALARLDRPWRLFVIGTGPARPDVEALFTNFADQVRFLGMTEDPVEMRKAYDAADLFVWPGVNEGVGMVYLEAQAAGVPVVAENHAAQRDVVAGGQLAPPDDPEALARAIQDAADDRYGLGEQARQHIVDFHGIGAAAGTLRTELAEIL